MKNQNKSSIKINITFYLIIFSIIILIVLWIFQIVSLNTMYEIEKTETMKESIQTLKNAYDSNDYNKLLDELAHNEDICIEIIENNNVIYSSSNYNKKCLNKNNEALRKFQSYFIQNNIESENVELVNPNFNNKTLVFGTKIYDNTYAFINSSLVPLDESINLLKSQFIYIALIVLLFAIIIAIFISKHISKPIIELTNGAKRLKKKDYSVRFDTNSRYSEIRELSETLNSAVMELETTDELRRDLMANVSHDLKTPLTMIKAYAEASRDLFSDNKEKREEELNIIIEETERLNILVEDILELSKLESNVEAINKEVFNLTELINIILKRYVILENEGYKFVLNYKKDLYVNADKKRIEQVIYNLVNNAVNYTGKDNLVTIKIDELSKNKVRVNIIDTGKGINPKEIDLIWDKYYKNKKKHKRNKFGTGLGLSIVKSILINHKLNYGVTSSSKGTCFYFDIETTKKNKSKN